jgi:hypothetical protein
MCLSHLIYTVRPCLIHTCHALTMSFFSRPRHSTAVESRSVSYLYAFGFFRLPRGFPRRLLSEAYQSYSQIFIPTTVKSSSSTLQKRRSVKLLDWQFGYFRLPRELSRRTQHCRSRTGARHGMCGLTAWHGRGTAWARHGHDMLCENRCVVYTGRSQWPRGLRSGSAATHLPGMRNRIPLVSMNACLLWAFCVFR